MTLRRRLLINMLLLSLIPLCVSSILIYWITLEKTQQEAVRSTVRTTYSIFNSFNDKVEELYETILNAVSMPEFVQYAQNYVTRTDSSIVYHNSEIVKAQMRTFAISNTSRITGICLYLIDNKILTYDVGTSHVNDYILDTTQAQAGIPFWYIDYDAGAQNGIYPITVSNVFMQTYSAKPMGTVVLTINPDIFSDLRSDRQWADGEMFFMLDSNNRIMLHPDEAMLGEYYTNEDVLSMVEQVEKEPTILSVEGRSCIVYATEVNHTGWKLFYIIPYSFFKSQPNTIINVFLLIIIPCAVIACIIALYTALSIYKPINRLTEQMSVSPSDALAHRSSEEGPLEIRAMAHSYNLLMERITGLLAETEEHAQAQKSLEMSMLRAQIMPHFLYNTLNVIKCLSASGDPEAVQHAVKSLISLLRSSIGSNRDIVELRQEIDYVNNYIYLQLLRLDLNLTLKWHIEDALLSYMVPRFILQPIVENALIHAFPDLTADNRITITASVDEEQQMLRITVADNGVGLSQDANQILTRKLTGLEAYSFNAVGLPNVNERIRLLFGDAYGIQIQNLAQGCEVTLILPVRKNVEPDAPAAPPSA